jgi:hypothetical protein
VLVVAVPVEDVVPAPDVGVVDGSSSATPPETLPATPERDCAAGDVVEVLALPTPDGVVPPGPSGVESLVPVWGRLVDRSAHTLVDVAPPDELPSEPQAPTPTTRVNAQPQAARVRCLRLMPTQLPDAPAAETYGVARSRVNTVTPDAGGCPDRRGGDRGCGGRVAARSSASRGDVANARSPRPAAPVPSSRFTTAAS